MAVYTEVADEELEAFIARYDVGALLSYKGIAEGVENTNFLVRTDRGQYILTLYEKRVAPDDLPFFLGLMEHLAVAGLSCPTPLRDRVGRNLATIAGRPAALVSFLDGIWVRRPQVHHCAAVGEALAKLHLAGSNFAIRRSNALGPAGWRPLFERFSTRADEVASGLEATIEQEVSQLERDWPSDLPDGVIHADLFPDNVFFLRDRLSGLIDFYFACNDVLAYDLAICLNAWCFEPDFAFNVTKGRALFRGYQNVRPLSALECAAMPTLARGAALRFLLTRAYDWLHTDAAALVKPHDPIAYLRRLRFHGSVKGPAEFGLEARA